ncbi:expressed unknown protein [Seminavis robusta]|uniref:Uncharacterized protein n=1 Tax=Seminavis robusta TaxID=568900 RepID=A0A9N8HLP7_9STRA|nr:expressed unknown protein [Seminavis robusta]|eukprot:Sro1049_g235431.1  (126) ;mRNA; r:32435-32812
MMAQRAWTVVAVLAVTLPHATFAFAPGNPHRRSCLHPKLLFVRLSVQQQSNENTKDKLELAGDDDTVQLGTQEYYQGFVSRSLDEEPVERVTGDAVLGPTFKFVGGFAVVLVGLVLGFMASNGLL